MFSSQDKIVTLSYAPESSHDWYERLSDKIADELKGYFKFRIKIGEEFLRVYNLWWAGLGNDVRITKHDMPQDEFEKYKKAIMATANAESLKSYKEVMTAYVGEK